MNRPMNLFARLPRVVLSLGAAALLGSLAVPAHGAIITVGGLITVTADDGASFKSGDTFTYGFTFDDQTVDTATETYNARFNAGVSAFSLARGGANVGTWDPAAGTFDVAPVKNFIAGANSDSVTIQATGSNFPAINGQPFYDVSLTFSFSGVRNFVDTGSGETFAQVVGVSPLDFATASSTFAEIRDSNYGSPNLVMTVGVPSSVPEIDPNSLGSVLALVLGSLGLLERRRLKAV
jgi:hypothetical protein